MKSQYNEQTDFQMDIHGNVEERSTRKPHKLEQDGSTPSTGYDTHETKHEACPPIVEPNSSRDRGVSGETYTSLRKSFCERKHYCSRCSLDCERRTN